MKNVSLLLIIIALLGIFPSCKRPPLPPPVLLFDQAHGQAASIQKNDHGKLGNLQGLFTEQGFIVQTNRDQFTKERLTNTAAVILSGPSQLFTKEEIQELLTYLNDGGQLCLMVRDVPSVADLLAQLGVAIANGVVREQENIIQGNEKYFSLINLPKHPLTKNLLSFNMYEAWPLKTALEANIIAKTSDQSWVDLNGNNTLEKQDAMQSFPVLITGQIGHGHFIVFGDDTLFENQFLSGNNEILGRNLARWLKEGSYY